MRLEELIALMVPKFLRGIVVTTTIKFDINSRFAAVEIQNVTAEWMLASELEIGEAPTPQPSPEQFLGLSWLFPQQTRYLRRHC